MRTFTNSDHETRVWPGIVDPEGHTVELAPGEEIELDLPDDFEDAHLVPVGGAAAASDTKDTKTTTKTDDGPKTSSAAPDKAPFTSTVDTASTSSAGTPASTTKEN